MSPETKAAKKPATTKKNAPAQKSVKDAPKAAEGETKTEAPAAVHKARAKPTLAPEVAEALEARREKQAKNPRFRRHEWWRYKKLGGKHAAWRVPRGIHSKTRRHWGYRPPLVSIGYRTPVEARGLHPSGFEEVLVQNPDDLAGMNKATQAARVGGTVGGRKAELIEKKAAELGIRILNPRREA